MAITGYEIRINGGSAQDVGNVTSHLATGLTAGTEYGFEVRSYDDDGNRSDWSSVVWESTLASADPSSVAGLVWWMKADALSLADGDPVAAWADASPEADDLAQGTGGNQPTYQTNEINGLPVVRFDGADDFLSTAKGELTEWTAYLVLKSGGTGAQYILAAGGDTTAIIQGFASGKIEYYNSPRTEVADINTSAFQIVKVTVGIAGNAGSWRLGGALAGGSAWAGDIAEIIVFNDGSLSAPDDALVMNYLETKYGL